VLGSSSHITANVAQRHPEDQDTTNHEPNVLQEPRRPSPSAISTSGLSQPEFELSSSSLVRSPIQGPVQVPMGNADVVELVEAHSR